MKTTRFIPVSKKKFILVLILSIALIATGIIGCTFFFDDRQIFKGCGALVVIGFFTLVVSLINIFNKSKGIILSQEGISINAGLVKTKLVWHDIKTIEEKSAVGQTFLVLILKNNETFLSGLSGMQKFGAKQNLQTLGSPAAINTKMLQIDKEELKSIINQYLVET